MFRKQIKREIKYILAFIVVLILIGVIIERSVDRYMIKTENQVAYKQTIITSENIPIGTQKNISDRYIRIPKWKTKINEINLEDDYMNRSIVITMKGITNQLITNQSIERYSGSNIYTGNPTSNLDDPIKNISIVRQNQDNQYDTVITVSLDKVYAYRIIEDESYVYIDLKSPKEVHERILVIDAGHGGNDSGTYSEGKKYYEKDLNLAIVLKLKDLLDKEDIKVYYTRLEDKKVYLRPRVNLANEVEADLFLSIHCNGSTSSVPNGISVLYDEKSQKQGFNSAIFADICMNEMVKGMNIQNRGLKKGNQIYIIGHSNVPVALIELGFMSNKSDMKMLKSDQNQKEIAAALYKGIMSSFGQLEGAE